MNDIARLANGQDWTVVELLAYLRSLDVRLWLEGDRLRYSAPDGIMTPVLRAELGRRKADIVFFLREAETAVHHGAPPIRPAPRDGALPLSFAQQRLWFLDQLSPGNAFYNIPQAIRLEGRLNVGALQQTLNEIGRRHEILRTAFPAVDGRPVQIIAPASAVPLPVVDLRGLPPAGREAEMRRLAVEEARRPFDLAQGPLWRTTLLRLGEDEHVVLFTMHHIVSDGWSIGVLVQEVVALYNAFAAGRASPLPPLPVQYADYAHWQRQWLDGEVLEEQLAYWRRQLAGAPALLDLPTDRPRPAVQTFRGTQQTLSLPVELSEALRALSRQEGVTLFMTLLAAFQTLLYRYSGQSDIPIGTPVANRTRAEVEGLIGFFVNTLVLRTDLSGNPTFRELLGRVREVTLGAYAHQDMPFEKLVAELQPERDLGHTPLFQVAFQLQNAQRLEASGHSGLRLRSLEVDSRTVKLDLTLSMTEGAERLTGSLAYNTDLFDDATASRMLAHFQRLLAGIVADPDAPILSLPLLTGAERRQLLVAWNDTAVDFPREMCIHQLVEAQVERTPDAVALAFENTYMTYGELNRRANQLAHYLRRAGVGPEVMVGICIERSLEMIVGLLGILKAGAAYVPLDPAYPQERLAYILEDTRMPVLITQQSLLERLPGHEARVICLDADWDEIGREGGANPDSPVTPDNLAYVIYTSGSTGKPKGTLLPHRGLCNFATAYVRRLEIGGESCVLQFFSFSFDGSVADIFTALVGGAKLCLVSRETLLSGQELAIRMQRERVSMMLVPPSMLAVLPADGYPALRSVLSGGESCTREIVAKWAPGRDFYNAYGPTEATVGPALYPVPDGGLEGTSVPIGRPIANNRVYLLDAHGQPVPVGVPGELYVGGVGVGRGYLHRPGLTAEKFVPDPFSPEPGARLYRTGDLARFRPDGNIEFLGRIDHQVKVRGFRIELGEIEAVLGQHPAVGEVVVLARDASPAGGQGDKRLVAYLTVRQEPAPAPGELRAYLQERLPDYMVPAAYVLLEALPLNPNGKVDRRALPAPEETLAGPERELAPPRTHKEELLADVFRQVLNVDRLGIYDNFFELGGDSLRGIQVIAKAGQAGLGLTPAQLFQHPTVAGLAAVADLVGAVDAPQDIVTGPVLLTPIQRWFFEQGFPDPHHWNWAFLRELPQPAPPALLSRTLRHLLVHHDALRLRFERTAAGWQAFNAGPDAERAVPLTVIDLSALPDGAVRPAIEAAAVALQGSLNLSRGPLLRVAYFNLGAERNDRVLIIFHHLVVDVISSRILMEDMQLALRQLSQGRPVELPAKTTSFQQWSRRLSEHAQSPELRRELADWLEALSGEVAPLPRDFPDGLNSEDSAALLVKPLAAEETEALLTALPAQTGAQIQEALLTALARTVAGWTGQPGLLLEMEGHGREYVIDGVDISRTVGWFTSMYPVRLAVDPTLTPLDALRAVQAQLRRIPNRGVGYGLLRYLCDDEEVRRALQALPPAEVNFNYLGQLDQRLAAATPFKVAPESKGPERSRRGRRTVPLYVVGSVRGGVLRMHWNYSTNLHRPGTIEQLAARYNEELRSLIAHCLS